MISVGGLYSATVTGEIADATGGWLGPYRWAYTPVLPSGSWPLLPQATTKSPAASIAAAASSWWSGVYVFTGNWPPCGAPAASHRRANTPLPPASEPPQATTKSPAG